MSEEIKKLTSLTNDFSKAVGEKYPDIAGLGIMMTFDQEDIRPFQEYAAMADILVQTIEKYKDRSKPLTSEEIDAKENLRRQGIKNIFEQNGFKHIPESLSSFGIPKQQDLDIVIIRLLDLSNKTLMKSLIQHNLSTEQDFIDFLSEQAKTEEVAALFEKHGAPNFARLCRLGAKPPAPSV